MTTLVALPMVLGAFGSAVLGWLMFMLSVFLILLILVQRGKGGGLTGALGGPGGQSAFGSKAGDTFTVITAVSAIIWGLVCAIAMYSLGVPPVIADDESFETDTPPALSSPLEDLGETTGAGGLSGIGGLLDDEPTSDAPASDDEDADADPEATDGTPSAELTPADADTTDASAEDTSTEGSDDASAGSGDTATGDAE